MTTFERLTVAARRYSAGGDLRRLVHKVPDRVTRDLGRRYPGRFYNGRVLSIDDGSREVARLLASPRPIMIGRLGATEQNTLRCFLAKPGHYPNFVRHDISTQAGVNPPTPDLLDRFCELYLRSLKEVDALGVWFHRVERRLVRTQVQGHTTLMPLRAIDPLGSTDPWAAQLEGKRICVVHPFSETIKAQYAKRELVFADHRFLPDFDLTVVPAVQAMGGLPAPYTSWFDALDGMTEQIANAGAEIVLIGAGAFGLPLAARAKALGLKAVHVGGALQLLFGIRGRRWDVESYASPFMNEHWTRPTNDERPAVADSVENACYW